MRRWHVRYVYRDMDTRADRDVKELQDCEGSHDQAGAPTTSHHALAWAYGSSLPKVDEEGGEKMPNVMKVLM